MKRRHDLSFPPVDGSATELRPTGVSRRALLAAIPALGASGCIGSFALTNRLLDWNRGLGNKWVSWLVFAIFFIIPVYPIVWGLVDLWVINSIEFWTGSAPFAKKDLPDGGQVITERTEDPNVARLAHHNAEGELVSELYIRREGDEKMTMLDREGRAVATVQGSNKIKMVKPDGEAISSLDATQIRRIRRAVETGASPSETAWEILQEQGDDMPMLAFAEDCQRRVLV
jgi:hypothetical protein